MYNVLTRPPQSLHDGIQARKPAPPIPIVKGWKKSNCHDAQCTQDALPIARVLSAFRVEGKRMIVFGIKVLRVSGGGLDSDDERN